jgi:hypothetical protein
LSQVRKASVVAAKYAANQDRDDDDAALPQRQQPPSQADRARAERPAARFPAARPSTRRSGGVGSALGRHGYDSVTPGSSELPS